MCRECVETLCDSPAPGDTHSGGGRALTLTLTLALALTLGLLTCTSRMCRSGSSQSVLRVCLHYEEPLLFL